MRDDVFDGVVIITFHFPLSCHVNGFPGHLKFRLNFNFAARHHGVLDGVCDGRFFVEQFPLEVVGIDHGLGLPLVVSFLTAAIDVMAFCDHVHFMLDNVLVDGPFVLKGVTVVGEDEPIENVGLVRFMLTLTQTSRKGTGRENTSCVIVGDNDRKVVDKPTTAKFEKNEGNNNEYKICEASPLNLKNKNFC